MSPSKEDCLKILYAQDVLGSLVSNKELAEKLGIAPASVTEMLLNLSKQGLVHYEAYKGSRLTPEGVTLCAALVRSHRLWEVFLINHLGYNWSDAHEDAHLLEHTSPMRLIERLDAFLKFPEYCPHGSRIPRSEKQNGESRYLQLLSEIQPNTLVSIQKIIEERDLMEYLEDCGISIGQRVRVDAVAPYEGSITITSKENSIQISYKAASQIFVQSLDNDIKK